MKPKNKKTNISKRASRLLPLAIITANLLNPGTPWRD